VLAREPGSLSLFVNAMALGDTVPAFATRVDRATGTLPTSMFIADLDADGKDEIAVLHDSDALWIYANRSAMPGPPTFEAARALELPAHNDAFAAPFDLDGQGPVDVLLVGSGDDPVQQLVNQATAPGTYPFGIIDSDVADVSSRKLVRHGAPTCLVRVDLDGVAPAEIVLSTTSWQTGSSGTFVMFDR
jgi:hypothetical protein